MDKDMERLGKERLKRVRRRRHHSSTWPAHIRELSFLSEAFRQDRKRKSHKLFSIQKFAAFTSSRINRFILSSKVSLLSLLK